MAARQGYRLTCLMSNLTEQEQAFYAGIGTISPYSHRINDRCGRGTVWFCHILILLILKRTQRDGSPVPHSAFGKYGKEVGIIDST